MTLSFCLQKMATVERDRSKVEIGSTVESEFTFQYNELRYTRVARLFQLAL